VVAAKLNAIRMMRATGDIPQNVNFAVEIGILNRFLAANGVRVGTAASIGDLHPADIGDRAKLFTYLIECDTGPVGSERAEMPIPNMPDYGSIAAPRSAPPKPIQVDPSKLKFSDLRRPYPYGAPEIIEINISNAGFDRVTELTIGFLR